VGSLTSHNPVGLHGLLRGKLHVEWSDSLKEQNLCVSNRISDMMILVPIAFSKFMMIWRSTSLCNDDTPAEDILDVVPTVEFRN
jgi:hypothetical protein